MKPQNSWEENIGSMLFDTSLSILLDVFLAETKAKIYKWNYIKLNFAQWNYQQNKKTAYWMEKIFAKNVSNKELISKIYKNTYNSTKQSD